MFHRHSMAGRVAVAVGVGFVIGGLVNLFLVSSGVNYTTTFSYGLWLFYILMSLTIAVMGIFIRHPIFRFPMRWWMRGAVIGAIYHLLLVLLAYDIVMEMMQLPIVTWLGLTSPFWVLLDGIVIGMIVGGVTTKVVG